MEELRRDEKKRGKKQARRLRDAKKQNLMRGTLEASGTQENMRQHTARCPDRAV